METSNSKKQHQFGETRLVPFPALASIGITKDDLEELSRQGFVNEERRGQRTYFKLRFRSAGRQVVRYIGDAARAAEVEEELAILQHRCKAMRDLKATTKLANKTLREVKKVMEPLFKANGLVFHGFALRRPRSN